MNTEELLRKATPRPWAVASNGMQANDGAVPIVASDPELECKRVALVDMQCKAKRGEGWKQQCAEREANRELIVLAVNSFEAQRELIAELVKALEQIDDACAVPYASAGEMLQNFRLLIDSSLARAREALK